MSSILDALRKLEEEKAQYPAPTHIPHPIEPITREPAPRRSRTRRPSRGAKRGQDHSRKLWVGVSVAIFAAGIIGAATIGLPRSDSVVNEQDLVAGVNAAPVASVEPDVANTASRFDTTLERIEADLLLVAAKPLRETQVSIPEASLRAPIRPAEVQPEPAQPEPKVPAAIPEPPPVEIEEPPASVLSESNTIVASIAPIQVEMSPVPIAFEVEVKRDMEPPVDFDPEPIEIAQVESEIVAAEPETYEEIIEAPRREPSENYRKAMAVSNALRDGTPLEGKRKPKVEVDIRRYDIMTDSVRARFGIPDLKINMLMQPNDRNPRPSALIDYNRVYIGEAIPDTKGLVHLIGIDIRGIAVEVDGERYYYPK